MPRPILLTYTLHPTQGPQREYLTDALTGIQAQLPLRNLHWKSSTRPALRTIQEVDVQLLELGEVGPQREVGGSVLDGALVNLCFIACDDADTYKNSTRSFIRDWLSLLSARRNVHAPLIILVNPPTAKDTGKNVFGRDKGILGKLKSDFNVGKRDRCVQVNLPSGNVAEPTAWPEVINRLKESIVSAFDAAILEREEEVKRGEAQRMTVGWNFCTWFLLKESLAYSFEGVNLHEDALTVYEELEATFLQILKEQNLSWFGKLGATGSEDDSLPILDVHSRPYKEMLQSSSISIFDFRVYVFARQAGLLGRLGRITEVAKRGQWFVASLTRRLRENEGDLAEHFIESWTYTACLDIVTKCDEWSRIDRPNGDYSGLIAYESARSELLDIARVQVERIGVSIGHLPNSYPFLPTSGLAINTDDVLFESSDNGLSDDGADTAHDAGPSRPSLSNKQLVDAMSDVKKYRNLYLSMTKKAMMAYEACGKVNSVVRLKADLAALAMHTNQWQTAYDLSRALAKACADLHIWSPVAHFALEGALQAHRQLKLEKDGEWANIATAYLRVGSDGFNGAKGFNRLEQREADEDAEVQMVIEGLRGIEEEHLVHEHKMFDISLIQGEAAALDESADTNSIIISIACHGATPLSVDEICLIYEHPMAGPIRFSVSGTILDPGHNEIEIASHTSCEGVLHLSSAQIWIGRTCFSYSHLSNDSQVILRRNPAAPSAALQMPLTISLDAEAAVVLRISSGLCEMKDVVISIESLQDEVGFDVSRLSSNNKNVTVSDTVAGISALAKGETADLVIPYRGTPPNETAHARIMMRYTHPQDDTSRTYIDAQTVFTGLPLTVNVQDFFRKDSLISHFTIASDGREYLRVRSVNLCAGEDTGIEVEQPPKRAGNTVISPEQHLSCLFKIRQSQQMRERNANSVLRLVIEYCNIEDEASLRITRTTSKSFTPADIRRKMSDRRSWLSNYARVGRIDGIPELELPEVSAQDLPWRTLEIPVDVPSRRILVIARLSPSTTSSDQSMIYEGRALPMTLTLTPSFAWWSTNPESQTKAPRLVFDINPNPDDWIVLGRKKGFWDAESDKSESHQITLIPMRPGPLLLPNITTALLPTSAQAETGITGREDQDVMCETYLENAAQVIRVLPSRKVVRALIPLAGMAGMAGERVGEYRREEWGVVV